MMTVAQEMIPPPRFKLNVSFTACELDILCFFLGGSCILDSYQQPVLVTVLLFCASTVDHVFSSRLSTHMLSCREAFSCLLLCTDSVHFKGQRENYSFRPQLAVRGRASCVLNCILPCEIRKRTLSC